MSSRPLPWSRGKAGGVQCSSRSSTSRCSSPTWVPAWARNSPPDGCSMAWDAATRCPSRFSAPSSPNTAFRATTFVAVGAFALVGAALLQFFADRLGGGAYEIGARVPQLRRLCCLHGSECRGLRPPSCGTKSSEIGGYIVPALGFFICGFIWVNLSNRRWCWAHVDGCRNRVRCNSHPRASARNWSPSRFPQTLRNERLFFVSAPAFRNEPIAHPWLRLDVLLPSRPPASCAPGRQRRADTPAGEPTALPTRR